MQDKNSDQLLAQARALLAAGDLSGTIAAARSARDLGHSGAHRILGDAYRRLGQLAESESCYRAAAAASSTDAELLNALGVVLTMRRRLPEAQACFRQAIDIEPRHAGAHANLGMALLQAGDAAAAVDSFETASRLDLQQPVSLTGWVRSLQACQRHEEAIRAARILTDRFPQLLEGHQRLGGSLEALGDLELAQSSFEAAARLDPSNVGTLFGLARIADRQERFPEALEFGTQALSQAPADGPLHLFVGKLKLKLSQPHTRISLPIPEKRRLGREAVGHLALAAKTLNDAPALAALGNAYRLQQQHIAAIECFERAIGLDANHLECLLGHSVTLMELGQEAAAARLLRRALSISPDCPGAWYQLAMSRQPQLSRDDVEQLGLLIDQPDHSPGERTLLLFALARGIEAAGNFDAAFDMYQRANGSKRHRGSRAAGSAADTGDIFASSRKFFSREFFRERAGWGSTSRRPIFVVGLPRSGTTLTEQILASHPEVYGAGELGDIAYLAQRLMRRADSRHVYPEGLSSVSAAEVRQAADDYEAVLSERSGGAQRVVDKLPGNYAFLGLIALLFPNCRIINVQRNPLDILVSCMRHNLDWPFCDLQATAEAYRTYVGIMQHWRAVLPIAVHDLKYERLVEDLAGESRRLLDYCDLPWDERCLNFHETDRAVRTPSRLQVRSALYRSSVNSWRNYERHLQPIVASLGDLVDEDRM